MTGKLLLGVLGLGAGLFALVHSANAKTSAGGPRGPTIAVKAKSGRTWTTETLGPRGDEVFVDVWTFDQTSPGGERKPSKEWWRVMRYAQKGSDKNARRFVGTPWGDNNATVRLARTDFGV